jgi:hypothetical protein
VGWIPGWQSAAAAGWWSNAWFWASILSLLLLGVCEMISHRYSERKDEISADQQQATQRQHDKDIATLQLQAAEANERAAKAQLALEKYKEPRTLNVEQQAAFVATLKPLAGQEFALSVAAGQEAAHLVCLFDRLLREAGWIRRELPGGAAFLTINTDCGPIAVNAASNIHVRASVNAPRATMEHADALFTALKATAFTIGAGRDPENIPIHTVILLMVGTKQ